MGWPKPDSKVNPLYRTCLLLGVVLLCWQIPACGTGPSERELCHILRASWQSYCLSYISPEGRVIIPEQGGGTISEAQAYALLRALWADDEQTFARVYAWTWQNLSRVKKFGDHLLAWQWGKKDDGSCGVIDWHTATDGDLDYALALQLAGRRGWRVPPPLPDYSEEARQVLHDILDKEVVSLPNGTLVLTPGNWHENAPPYLLNPSYFSPGFYPLFHLLRPDARWARLQDDTYRLLQELRNKMDQAPGVGLFPNWCRIEADGRLAPAPGRDNHFGWDAVRLPYRLALDALWHRNPQAVQLLADTILPFAKKEWHLRGRLAAIYTYRGQSLAPFESPVIYAGVLAAALAVNDKPFAHEMARKILSFYRQYGRLAYFMAPENYYDNNWAWLGLALYAGWVRVF